MVNASLNLASLLGLALVLLSVFLLIKQGGQPSPAIHPVQNLALTLVYLITGLILLFQGWRLDPILQVSQLLLIGSNIFWVVNDRSHRP